MKATLTSAQVAPLLSLRSSPEDAAKSVRTALFKSFKDSFGIPDAHKVSVDLDAVGTPAFGVIVRKKTGLAYDLGADGKWNGQEVPVIDAPATPAAAPDAERRWFRLCGEDLRDAVVKLKVDADGDLWVGLTADQVS